MKRYLLPLLLFILSACGNNNRSPIPDVPVNLDINITADAPELFTLGGYKEFIVPITTSQYLGYGGLLLVRTFEDEICAFDLSCPHEAKSTVRIKADNSGVARCDSCGSTYNIGYGSGFAQSGPTKYKLKKYTVYYNVGSGNIYVTR